MKTPWTTVLAAACVASVNAAEMPKDYKPSPQDFRIVDGVRYNIKLSTNWITVPKDPASRLGKDPGAPFVFVSTKVETVIPEGVVFTFVRTREVMRQGFVVGTEKTDGPKFLVKNHPDKATLTTGRRMEPMILMHVGTFQYGGEVIAMYDYGLPNVGTIKVTDATNRVTTGTNQLSR